MISNRIERGGTLLGFVVGLVVGLGVAVAVALYITNAPLPFVAKVKRPTANVNPAPGAPLPDPNKPLYGSNKTEPAPAESKAAALPAPAPLPEKAAEPQAGKGPADDGTRFLLQAGAFRSPDEADTMRARLALLGLDARIFPIEQGGQTLYRVRLGPYGQVDEINRTRKLLAENSIDAQVVRLK